MRTQISVILHACIILYCYISCTAASLLRLNYISLMCIITGTSFFKCWHWHQCWKLFARDREIWTAELEEIAWCKAASWLLVVDRLIQENAVLMLNKIFEHGHSLPLSLHHELIRDLGMCARAYSQDWGRGICQQVRLRAKAFKPWDGANNKKIIHNVKNCWYVLSYMEWNYWLILITIKTL